jgi:SAM-dependent methyltransferase
MGWFKHWFSTPYYVLLYGHRDEVEARTWVDTILERWALPPGSRILDMACGRGRHARWFANAGMDVTGIDISEESIQDARARSPEIDFRVHDMREPVALDRFDGISCLFTSLGYFDTPDDDRLVFAAAMKALRPGGRFIIDHMNTNVVLSRLVEEEQLVRQGIHFRITRSLEAGVIVKRIQVEDAGKVHHFEERVLALMPDQIEGMAREAGLVIEDVTDGPDASAFDPFLSQRFVLWMKKPEA